jgi:hypothetical protein
VTRRYRGLPRIWARCGCLGCSVPLLMLAAVVALVLILG